MSELDRVRDARQAAQAGAAERWHSRGVARAETLRRIDVGGAGAADSPQRALRAQTRGIAFRQACKLRRQGLLPPGLERRMGPTLDFMDAAPSEAARRAGRPVARLVDRSGPGLLPQGFATGFLVTPELLLTNQHVFPEAAFAAGAAANFLHEQDERGLQLGPVVPLDPERFFLADPAFDFALVALQPRSADGRDTAEFGTIALIEATSKILKGQPINIIQHPEGGPKQYAVRDNRLLDLLDEGFLHYETDTLEGSSGAPCFSERWELVALHHVSIPELRDGEPVARDGSIWRPGMPPDAIRWIANEGVRVSAIVRRLAEIRLADPRRQAMLDGLLAQTTDPVDELTRAMAMPPAPVPLGAPTAAPPVMPATGWAATQPAATFTGPVTIHVHAAGAPRPIGTPALFAEEATLRFDRDYAGRRGYDPGFLAPEAPALRVPPPEVADDRRAELLAERDGTPLILRYRHFELAMHAARRLQVWSAANVDYAPRRKGFRSRDDFGRDRWIPDPRIPAAAQILDAEFYRPAGNIDRGHMVRREDNAWGDSPREIEFANSDTFHWTNCTPQHEAFNQAAPGGDRRYRDLVGLWGAFEQHVQASLVLAGTRACLLAGPVLDADDPSADFGSGAIQYPVRFWKVVAAPRSDGTLGVFGFVFSQAAVVERFGIEAFGPGRFAAFQRPLTEIEDIAGVVFDPALHAADTASPAVA